MTLECKNSSANSVALSIPYTLFLAFNNLAALDAASADLNALGAAARRRSGLHRLQIRVPAPTGYVVRVRDVVSELRSLTAKLTYLCHDIAPKIKLVPQTSRELHADHRPLPGLDIPYLCGVSG